MARDMGLTATEALFGAHTDEAALVLLTLDHATLEEPVRLVRNDEDITSRTNTYTAAGFDPYFPTEEDGTISEVQISIGNVDRSILQTIYTLSTPPSVTLELILASEPDTVIAGPFLFALQKAVWNAETITGTLGYPPVLDEPFPGDKFTPLNNPGLFSGQL